MLTVKTGNYHPALEKSLVKTVCKLKEGNPLTPIAIVTPTNWMQKRIQELLVREADSTFLNIYFMNFYILAHEVCIHSGVNPGIIISQPFIYEGLITNLLNACPASDDFLKNTLSPSSIACALYQVFQDLTDANVKVEDLRAVVHEGFLEGMEVQKLTGLIDLYDLFRKSLKTMNVSHFSDIYRLASTCVPESPFLRRFEHILAYGFYDLTGVEQDFLGEIFRHYQVTLFLPYQKNHPAFSYVKPFFESFVLGIACEIEEISADNDTGFTYLIDPVPHGIHTEFTPAHTVKVDNPSIQIINTSGKRDEIWATAKEIVKLTENGYKMEEIGVVARTLESYAEGIMKIFLENCIPFTITCQEPLGKYPFVKTVRQLLLLKHDKFYRPMVIDLLGSPYFNMPLLPRNDRIVPRPDLWDILSRRLGIRNGIESWLSRLKQSKTNPQDVPSPRFSDVPGEETHIQTTRRRRIGYPFLTQENMGEAEITGDRDRKYIHIPVEQIEFLEHILHRLSDDLFSLPEKAPWSVMSDRISRFIQTYIRIPEDIADEERDRDHLIQTRIQDMLCIVSSLDCLGREVTVDQFIDTFIGSLQREVIPAAVENDRGVKVMDVMAARGVPFRALFILGLNGKRFPRAISEDPFLRDHVRRRLSDVLGNNLPEKLRGFDEERLLFYFLLNAARERLYLVYERSEETGKPEVPSHYLIDVMQRIKAMSGTHDAMRNGTDYEFHIPRSIKEKLCMKDPFLLTPKEMGIRMALEHIDPAAFLKVSGPEPVAYARSRSALQHIESYTPYLTLYDGIIGNIIKKYGKGGYREITPTTLEVFGLCPFKFFMREILKLESLEEPEKVEDIAVEDMGNLYHDILKDFYHNLIKAGYFTGETDVINPVELLHGITRKYFKEMEQQMPNPYPVSWEVKKEEIMAFLTRFISWELNHLKQTGYIPVYLEKTIKLNPQNSLFLFNFPVSKRGEYLALPVRGKIDRIDLKTTGDTVYFRVIDYKSGRGLRENLLKSAIRGQRLQLPFYIIMAEHLVLEEITRGRNMKIKTKMEEASFVYITQDEEDKSGQTVPSKRSIIMDDWKEHMEQCKNTVKEFMKIIHTGLFPASPKEDTQACTWCEFATVCRRTLHPQQFRLEHDSRLERYREIISSNIIKKPKKEK